MAGNLTKLEKHYRDFDENLDKRKRAKAYFCDGVVELMVGEKCPDAIINRIKIMFLGPGVNRYSVKVIRNKDYDGIT